MKYRYAMLLFLLGITACSPATKTQPANLPVETLSASPTPSIPTSTTTPIPTTLIYPTFTPAPTPTALPALASGEVLTLTNIYMNDEQNGWGIDIGEHIIHTKDGGLTWQNVTPPSGGYLSHGFFALDANTAWATSTQYGCYTAICSPAPNNASVWYTTDGGSNWQEQHVCIQGTDCDFNFDIVPSYYYPVAIHFSDAQNGWLLITVEHVMFQDRYVLYRTTDGGTHWVPILTNFSGPMVMGITGLAFQDQQTGWMTTSQIDGATDPIADWSLYQSTDSGFTWNEVELPKPDPMPERFTANTVWCGAYGVDLIPPNTLDVTFQCRVYTDPVSKDDFYFHSSDGGKHWISWLKTGDVEFITPLIGWQSTLNNNVYDLEQTHDGGQTWIKIKIVQWKGDFDFVNERIGWAIATIGDTMALVHTMDGGKTWDEIKPVVAGN